MKYKKKKKRPKKTSELKCVCFTILTVFLFIYVMPTWQNVSEMIILLFADSLVELLSTGHTLGFWPSLPTHLFIVLACFSLLPFLVVRGLMELTVFSLSVPFPVHGVRVSLLAHQRRRHVCDVCGDAGEQHPGVAVQPSVPVHLHLTLHLHGVVTVYRSHHRSLWDH